MICKEKWKVVCKDGVLVGNSPAGSQLTVASECGPGLKETLAQLFALLSPKIQTLYHSRQDSELAMEPFVLSPCLEPMNHFHKTL